MAALRGYLITAAVALLVGVGGGLGFGWKHWRPQSVVETPAPSARQKDGSLELARVPDVKAKPAQVVPPGAIVERVDHIVVQPRATGQQIGNELPPNPALVSHETVQAKADSGFTLAISPATSAASCPPVRVDLTLIRLKDNTERVLASSPDGTVLDSLSVDHPVAPAMPVAKPLHWSAGPMWGGGDNGVGVNLTRDLGPVRLVGAIMRAPARGPLPVRAVAMLAANIRF